MLPTSAEVRQIFAPLAIYGEQQKFWDVVADDVDWEIPGRSPMSGKYSSKEEFLAATIEVLGNEVLKEPLRIQVDNVIGGDSDWAVVEMHAIDAECRNGMVYDMRYCWCCRFDQNKKIVQVRAYIDTDLLKTCVEANPKQ